MFPAPSPLACITVSRHQIWPFGITFSLHTTVNWLHVCIGWSTSMSKNGRQHQQRLVCFWKAMSANGMQPQQMLECI